MVGSEMRNEVALHVIEKIYLANFQASDAPATPVGRSTELRTQSREYYILGAVGCVR